MAWRVGGFQSQQKEGDELDRLERTRRGSSQSESAPERLWRGAARESETGIFSPWPPQIGTPLL